jgi:hypothetical protein
VPKVKVSRIKTRIKLKTKSKTANRNVDKRPPQIAIAKATKTNLCSDRNRSLDEAAPTSTSDAENVPGVQ